MIVSCHIIAHYIPTSHLQRYIKKLLIHRNFCHLFVFVSKSNLTQESTSDIERGMIIGALLT
jgi:hypothetical protein